MKKWRRMLKYIDKLSLFFLFLSIANYAIAQDDIDLEEIDSTKIEFEFIPKSFRVGMDMVGLVKTLSQNEYTELEITSDIAVDKYFLNFEYGILERNRVGDSINYFVNGTFLRVGLDFNFLKNDPDGNAFFFGVKYALGKSNHSLDFNYTDPIFGSISESREVNAINARWFEINTGIKVKLFWEIWLGFTGRLKFALKHDNTIVLDPYEIPGYGFSEQKVMWGFDYYVFYRIPFSKRKTQLPTEK
ncbi:MAG: DUF6048 family protein [Cyclobacteriaceae bacterium]|nr:DUF6048 family protein [Cyclobacteriaceae bacterium]